MTVKVPFVRGAMTVAGTGSSPNNSDSRNLCGLVGSLYMVLKMRFWRLHTSNKAQQGIA